MKLGCIADDYTGATDLACLLHRSGASVRLHFETPNSAINSAYDIEIIALKCRTAPVEKAIRLCCAAGEWLLEKGASTLYWKYCSTFDSTATGNIGPVAEALMELSNKTQILYCPSFPENDRRVFMGHLFVGDQLLNESSLKDHPLTPMTDANLCRILEAQVNSSVGLWNLLEQRKNESFPKNVHVIADAIALEDLEFLVEKTPSNVLLTGGSALAMPITKKIGLVKTGHNLYPKPAPASLILSGSCSDMTIRQVERYVGCGPMFQLDPLNLENNGLKDCLDWLHSQSIKVTPLIYATSTPEEVRHIQNKLGVSEAGNLIEHAMATIAKSAQLKGIRRFVVAGGETSGAVTQALGIRSVEIGPEICPGIPWVFAEPQDNPIALALKSGNFGAETFFTDALKKLPI